jgi:membrane-bound lytic murein transglycosylase D
MHKLFLLLFLLFPVISSYSQSLTETVNSESEALLLCSLKGKKCSSLLDIPWDKPAFQFWLSYYKKGWNRAKLMSKLDSFKIFYPTVAAIFKKEGLPEDLALLAVVESSANPSAVSRAGAAGLWQLMPSTARRLGLKVNWLIDERFDVVKSTEAAARYLKELYSQFHRWDLAIAAYNAGPGTILSRLKKLGVNEFWDLTKLPNETLNYVPKFYAVLSVAKESLKFRTGKNGKLLKIKVKSRTSLYRIARTLKVKYSVLKRFNRQFKRRIVPAGYYVYLPKSKVRNYAVLRYSKSSKIYIYVPRRREKLTVIARKFGVSPKLLKRVNRFKYNVVFRGQPVIIVKLDRKGKNGNG